MQSRRFNKIGRPQEKERHEILLLKEKLTQATLLLEILAQVNSLMSKQQGFEEFFIEVGKILKERLNFKYIHIWIRDEKNPHQLCLVTPETLDGFRTMSIDTGIVGKTIQEGRTFCIPRVHEEPAYRNIHPETVSELCVPLIYSGHVLGAINIETDIPNTFADQRSVIEVIAENLSHSMKVAMLYKTEEQFHQLIEHMSEGVWVGDSEEKTLYVNPAYTKMTGNTLEDMCNKTTYDVFDKKSVEIIRKENEKRKRGLEGHYEASYISKSGERIPVMIHAVPFGDGGTMATITDLREIKNTEKALARAESFLASITQYCPEAIVGLDEGGSIQSWNRGAEHIFGHKAEDVRGKSIEMIMPADRIASGELTQLLSETKMKGLVRNFETVRLHKNGRPLLVSLTLSAVKDDQGKIIGLAALYRDITAQKKWERELQDRFEKMQEAYREMGKQRRYLDYLMDMISMAASTQLTKKQIATFTVNAITVITKVDAATIRVLDHASGKLILTAQTGLSEDWSSKKAISYHGSLVEAALKTGYALKILDILSDPRYTSPALARKNNLRSALIIPLEAKGEVLGSLTLYLSQEGNLNLLDDEFIGIFAKQAGVALKLAS